jgi:hypothetical protein
MNKAIIRLEKLIPGGLNIELENYKTGNTVRAYTWKYDQDIIRVSIDLAISVFSVPGTTKLYEQAYFKIHKDDEEDVLKLATDLQIKMLLQQDWYNHVQLNCKMN